MEPEEYAHFLLEASLASESEADDHTESSISSKTTSSDEDEWEELVDETAQEIFIPCDRPPRLCNKPRGHRGACNKLREPESDVEDDSDTELDSPRRAARSNARGAQVIDDDDPPQADDEDPPPSEVFIDDSSDTGGEGEDDEEVEEEEEGEEAAAVPVGAGQAQARRERARQPSSLEVLATQAAAQRSDAARAEANALDDAIAMQVKESMLKNMIKYHLERLAPLHDPERFESVFSLEFQATPDINPKNHAAVVAFTRKTMDKMVGFM